MKKSGYIPLILAVLLVLFPKISISAAGEGLKVWASTVFPSLFPFAVVSSMLVSFDMLKWADTLFYPVVKHLHLSKASSQAIAVGALSGYPVGAMVTKNLYINEKISGDDVELTAFASSFCSPMFIIGTLGTGMLHDAKAGIAILVANYMSYIIIISIYGVVMKKKTGSQRVIYVQQNKNYVNFGSVLKKSVDNASSALISVCGYIVLFSVVMGLIEHMLIPKSIIAIISAVLEISGGCAKISQASFSMSIKTALSAFAVSWGGTCVVMQISGFINECGIKCRKLLLFKFIQGVVSSLLAFMTAKYLFLFD